MKCLALPGIVPTDEERALIWSRMSDEQRRCVTLWANAFQAAASVETSVNAMLKRVANTMIVSYATARRMRDWAIKGKVVASTRIVFGWQAWLDYRSSANLLDDDAVPAATVQWWKQIIDQFKGRKNCRRQAYQRVIAMWKLTEMAIPGYDTPPPSETHGHPKGWSYGNFCRLTRTSKFESTLAHTGAKAAAKYAFHVPTTRVGLEVAQYIMVDDQWHDFKVKRTISATAGRMLELFALDLYSAKRIAYGLKCEVEDDETKIRQRLQERDMRFLLAAMFSLYGFRKAGTTIICEAGTAVVRDDIAKVLFDCTGGAITVEMGKTQSNPAFPEWYRGRSGGNPRFKAALESSLNLVRNATAMLAAQTGSNERVNAPEELHGRSEADRSLVKALSKLELTAEKMAWVRWPAMLQSQASEILDDIYRFLDGRDEHDLEGWEAAGLVTGEIRIDPRSRLWTPTYAYPTPTEEDSAALQALMRLPGCFRLRKMSPVEVWEQQAARLVRIPMSVLPEIIGKDLAVERKVNDHGSFTFNDADLSPEPLRYVGIAEDPHGHQILLKAGEIYRTFCNPFDRRYLLVCDAVGRYIGRCLAVNRVCRADDEGLHKAMGQAAMVNGARSRDFAARNAGHAEQRVADEAFNERLLAGAPVTPDEKAADRARNRAISQMDPGALLDDPQDVATPEAVPAGAGEFDVGTLL